MVRTKFRLLVAATLFGSGVLGAAVASGDQESVRLRPEHRMTVATGKVLYAEHCASCHGARLQGQFNWRKRLPNGRLPAPPHDESGHTWHHNDELLFRITKSGPAAIAGADYESDMPPFEGVLTDAQIVAVLSYIKSRWPAEIRQRHDRMGAGRR